MEPVRVPTGDRASFGVRFVAALIDGILLAVVNAVLTVVDLQIAGLIVSLAYFTYFEGGETGQTIGKRVMNIRVADFENGAAIGYGRAAIRWVARFLSAIPLGLGYFWMLWDAEKQTWHDKLSTSVVVGASAQSA
jgi:uncharacterized RDD family membrane protein YckC